MSGTVFHRLSPTVCEVTCSKPIGHRASWRRMSFGISSMPRRSDAEGRSEHFVHPPCRKLRSRRKLIEQSTFQQAVVTTGFAQVYGNRTPLLAGIDQAPVLWQQSPVRGDLNIEMSRGLRFENVAPRNGDMPAHRCYVRIDIRRTACIGDFQAMSGDMIPNVSGHRISERPSDHG